MGHTIHGKQVGNIGFGLMGKLREGRGMRKRLWLTTEQA